MIISIIPVIIGGGLKLFKGDYPYSALSHIETKSFQKGLVKNHYKILR